MVKPLLNMKKHSNMTLTWFNDGGKLSEKWGVSLAGIFMIS